MAMDESIERAALKEAQALAAFTAYICALCARRERCQKCLTDKYLMALLKAARQNGYFRGAREMKELILSGKEPDGMEPKNKGKEN